MERAENQLPPAPRGGNTYKVPEGSSALRVLLYLDHPQRSCSLWLSDAFRLLEAQFIPALRGSLQFIRGSVVKTRVFGHQTAVKSTHTNRPLRTPKRKASPGPGRSDSSVNCWDRQAETHPASRRQIKEDHRGGIYKYSPDITESLHSGSLVEDKREDGGASAFSSPTVRSFDQRQHRFNQRLQRQHAETHSANYC